MEQGQVGVCQNWKNTPPREKHKQDIECECTDVQVPRLRSISGRNLCPVKLLVVPEEVKVLR